MTALLLIAVVLLVFTNGFFVAAEFALVRSRRSKLEELANDGQTAARRVVKQIDDISEYLSACQFGITLASLGIGFLGEPAIAELVEPALGGLSHGVAVAISIGIAYVLVTALHITAGEQVPKIYAIVKAEAVAVRVARPLDWFNILMRPFIHVLNGASNGILRLMRINPDAQFAENQSPEELRFLIAQAHVGGSLDAGEAGMLQGVFHLHEQEARQETKPLDDLLADLQRERSSMAVVIDEYGRVAGIVTVEDIIEEVVGEIADETDPAGGEVRRLANGDWFVRGHVAVTDLLDYGLELPVDTDAYNSVGGFVFAELGRLPKRGDTITADGYSIRVESVRENRIEAVRIRERRAVAGQQRSE